MTIIKIDPSSIKKNPRAFQTHTTVMGPKEFNFSYEFLTGNDFLFLKNIKDGVFIKRWTNTTGGNLKNVSGYCCQESDLNKLPKNGLIIEVKNNVEYINHSPEPEFLYKYIPTEVKCSDCNKLILNSDIQIDCDDDGCWTICPNCSKLGAFEFEYQKISEVINKVGY